MSATVIAFDGVLFPTLELRADALLNAATTEGIAVTREALLAALPGRTLAEVSEVVFGTNDATLTDMLAIRAQQTVAQQMVHGLSVAPALIHWIGTRRAAGHRLLLRADSPRVLVDRTLSLFELEYTFTVVRCADDPPRDHRLSSIERSYRALMSRLDALRISGERCALEYGGEAAHVAALHGLVALDSATTFQECRPMHRELPPSVF